MWPWWWSVLNEVGQAARGTSLVMTRHVDDVYVQLLPR